MYEKYFKRLFDIVLSCILIFCLFPLMILIFSMVWLFIGFPIFAQKRPGLHGKIFTLYKFKTLYDSSSKNIAEDKRQSKFGNFLRKTGIDEFPQLFNVLGNSMSIVGPRPLLIEYLNSYTVDENKRHLVKPGITGLAQVFPNPSGEKSWSKSMELDIHYSKNVSFLLDMRILIKTFLLILFQKKQYKDFKKFYE